MSSAPPPPQLEPLPPRGSSLGAVDGVAGVAPVAVGLARSASSSGKASPVPPSPVPGVIHGPMHQIKPLATSPHYEDPVVEAPERGRSPGLDNSSSRELKDTRSGADGSASAAPQDRDRDHDSPVSPSGSGSGAHSPTSASAGAANSSLLPAIQSVTELHRVPSLTSAHGMPSASLQLLSDRLKSQHLEEAREKEAEIDKKILSTIDVAERVRQEGAREGVGLGVEASVGNTFKSLEEIYDSRDLAAERQRYKKIHDKFVEVYGAEPEFYARSPGRVNLIGDNIDQNGFPVLPLALDRDVVVAVRTSSTPKFELNNTSSQWTSRSFNILPASDSFVDFDPRKSDWATRAKSAFRTTCEMLALQEPKGMQCLLDGAIPVSAGLASSAAYVSAICLAICRANGQSAKRGDLVKAAQSAEEALGIKGGGADQCASLLPPSRGTSLLVSFEDDGTTGSSTPGVKSEVVMLPPGAAFVVADSCVVVDKLASGPARANVRLAETRLAAATIENDINLILASANKPTLRMVQDAYLEREEKEFGEGLGKEAEEIGELKDLVEERWETLEGGRGWREKGYGEGDVGEELGLSIEDLRARYLSDINIVMPERFHLYRRAIHVFAEAGRVYEFRDLCRKAAIEAELGLEHGTGEDVLKELGAIMNASQASSRDLYDSSCPEIDELVSICLERGALGCKMTGAGWGGCTISLVREQDVDSFVEGVRQAYHAKKFPDKAKDPAWLEDVVFGTGAGVGGGIIEGADIDL